MTATRGAAAVLVLLLAVGACGSSDGSDGPPSSSAPTSAAVDESKACSFLSAADRRQLAGVALDTVVASDARAGGSAQCRWSSDRGLIEVTSVPASSWAKTLPQVLAQLESQVDTKEDRTQLARAKRALAGATTFDDNQACDAFKTLARFDGGTADDDLTIRYIPISQTEVGVSGQVCSEGRLTSIVYSEPGLEESRRYDKAVRVALRAAQERATA